jgi:hypothetical protein
MVSAGAATELRRSHAMTGISRAPVRFLPRARSSIVIGLALPCLARAQESVPTELALALLRFGSDRPATILVGRIPEEYSADVNVPRGARVLGSLVSSRQTTIIVSGTGSTDSLRAGVERTLLARGWTRFQPPYAARGGFVNEASERYPRFCKGSSNSVNVSLAATGKGIAQARLDFVPGGMCDTSNVVRAQHTDFAGVRQMEFPTLRAPAGSSGEATQECFAARRSGFGARSSTATFVRTTMSPSEILAHYGAQLSAQGWKPTPSRETAAWTTRDSTGIARTVVLSASRIEGSSCFNVEMSLSTERN